MAATVSTGGLWPDGSRAKQGNVVIWSGEDDPEDTLVPKLIASGADVRRVHFVGNIRDESASRSFDPAKDITELANAIERFGDVLLVVVDPIAMVATKDSHRNAETRRDLQPVADLCRTTGAAVLGIHHLAKGTGGREPQERLIGSIAFAAMPRVVMIAAKIPSEDHGASERRVLMRAKSNIGPDDGGFAYTLSQIELERHPGDFGSRVVWGAPIEGTAREVLAEAEEMEEQRSPREEAVEFLKSLLVNGAVPVAEIHAASRKEGISTATLRRAKAKLGVASSRIGFGKGGIGQWEMSPENPYLLTTPHRCSLKSVSTYGEGEHVRTLGCGPNDREEVEPAYRRPLPSASGVVFHHNRGFISSRPTSTSPVQTQHDAEAKAQGKGGCGMNSVRWWEKYGFKPLSPQRQVLHPRPPDRFAARKLIEATQPERYIVPPSKRAVGRSATGMLQRQDRDS
jgi:putative DNA primase/helicase